MVEMHLESLKEFVSCRTPGEIPSRNPGEIRGVIPEEISEIIPGRNSTTWGYLCMFSWMNSWRKFWRND